MGKYFIVLLMITLYSCCNINVESSYSYKGIQIKRIDSCGKSTFYYSNPGKNAGKIWVEYSGINDGFSGYLKFEEKGKVFILSGNGYFQSENIDTSRFEFKRILAYQRPELVKNVYYIELSTKYEKEKNLNSQTNVIVKYGN